MSPKKSPFFELRSGAVDTLLFVVKTTSLDEMRAELTRRFEATPEFFANDTVAIDVRRLAENERVPLADIAKLLDSVRMRPIGVVADTVQHAWANEAGLPLLDARDPRGGGKTGGANGNGDEAGDEAGKASAQPAQTASSAPTTPATPMQLQLQMPVDEPETPATAIEAVRIDTSSSASQTTMVIDKPLRSGQRIYAKGDLVVLGMVSNGAEVIAEGNIHIYAPLRGRALAGVHGNHDARIFCTCLEPELISIAGIYRTTENPLPADVHGKPAQIWLEEEKLMIETMRLT